MLPFAQIDLETKNSSQDKDLLLVSPKNQHATGLTPPRSTFQMIGKWLSNFDDNESHVMFVGAATLCSAIWRCHIDIILKSKLHSRSPELVSKFRLGPQTLKSFIWVPKVH